MNNDLDLTPFPTFDEFSVGQMLPQCGSTLGMSSDDESIEDLIDKDNHMFIQEDSKKNILDSFKEKELTKSDIFYLKKEHKKLQELKGKEEVIGYYDGKNLIAFYIIEDRNNYTYLKTIWVDENYRQKGIASKIMEKIKEENNNIETNVEDDNQVGKKLADKHGFRRRGKDKYGNIMVYRGNKKSDSVNESVSDVDKIINTFTKEELKEYAPQGNNGKHENVVYRDVKKINGMPVAFIEVDQGPDDKKKNDCNIAVGCSPEYRGKGYVKELLNKFIKNEGHKYNKIWYGYKKTNTNSKRLIESIGGFKNVGGREGMEWNTLEIKESALSSDNSIIRDHVNKIHNEYLKYNNKGRAGNQNCLLCTWCFEARIRGYDILPRPVYSPRDTVLQFHGNEIVKNPKIKFNNLNDLKNIIIKSGDGSRFYIHVNWKNSSSGHEFILININNKIYVIDPQAGIFSKISTDKGKKYFDINFSNSYLIRLDDKDIDINLIKSQNSKSKIIEWDDDKDISYMKKHNMLSDNDLKELNESALSSDDRNNIKTKDFGLPDKRKYPMPDKEHVLLAIKFFNYCPAEDKDELAKNIIDKIGYYFDDGEKLDIKIGDKNSFKKYWDSSINESALSTKERNRLDDSFFGLPAQRKYPMPDKKHVLLAIKFFNQCPSKYKKELSVNINNRINELFSEEEKKKINIGNTNTFLKYYNTNESALININEGYFSELEIQIQDSGCDILENYVFNNKPTQQGFINGTTWNSLIMYNGKRYRERVEALILDDHNHIFLAFKDKDRSKYKIPGGSSEKNQTLMQQLQDECNEEAKIYIKDIKYIFTYTMPYNNNQYTDAPYYGYFAHVFVAKYNGKYLKPVKEKDLDLTILNNGRFYDITDIFDKLTPVHKAALLQSNQLK